MRSTAKLFGCAFWLKIAQSVFLGVFPGQPVQVLVPVCVAGAANTGPITRICMASLQVSNTVAVLFHKDKCPTTVAEAAEVFATIGDVARLDMSLGTTVGLLFVTFYDVRVAQRVVQHTKPFAWPAQAGMDDFRAVSWSSSQFANLPRQERGFERFGEIARIFSCGGDIIIEFYDMRAALHCCISIPGSQPKKCGPMSHKTGDTVGSAKDTDMTGWGGSARKAPPWLPHRFSCGRCGALRV